jgi:hypothetical protein
MSSRINRSLYVSSAGAVFVVILFAWLSRWQGLSLFIDPHNVLSAMSPLLLTAGFIERAVEVVISPWRDTGAAKLANKVDALRTQIPASEPNAIAAADSAFQEYKGQTQRYAFGVSLSFSLAAAYVGVRALWPFVEHSRFEKLSHSQQWMFVVVDMVLTAALLAGGADGIHSVINAFTTFFNTTAQKAQQSANASRSGELSKS